MNKTELSLQKANIDDYTMEYLEKVSGKKGQEALNAWLTYTGWIFSGTEFQKGIQISIENRIQNAKSNARAIPWKPEEQHKKYCNQVLPVL